MLSRKRPKSVGRPPGSLLAPSEIGRRPAEKYLFEYDRDSYRERPVGPDIDFDSMRDGRRTSWLNIDGTYDSPLLELIGSALHIHPLVLEDIQNPDLRPKLEDYEEHLFLSLKMLRWQQERKEILSEQVSVIIGASWVISFQEQQEGDVFESIRERIRNGKGKVRRSGADYLAYGLIDSMVDNYFLVLEALEGEFEQVEDQVMFGARADLTEKMHGLRSQLLTLRRAVWPLREAINDLFEEPRQLIKKASIPYFRDVYDHLVEIVESTEILREMMAGLLDLHISTLSKNLNSTMKVLTMIGSIFIPLTFVAGVYGMNFRVMPELAWEYGYPVVLAVMVLIVVGLLVFFRRRKWL